MAIDFSNVDDYRKIEADPSSLPPSGVPPLNPNAPIVNPPLANPLAVTPAAAQALGAAPLAPAPVPAVPAATPAAAPAPTVAPPAPAIPKVHHTQSGNPPQDPTFALRASSERVNLADEAHAKAMAETGEQDQANAGAEAEARDNQARDLKTQQALQAMDRQQADTDVAHARERYSAKKFEGIFRSSDGSINWGRAIAGGIAQILGSLSFDSNHVNQVTQQIDNAIKQKFEQEQAEKSDLFRDVQLSLDAKQALRADQLQEMGEFRAYQAAALDAVIAKGKSLSALSKNKEGIAAVEAQNARYAFERDKAEDEAKRLYQGAAEKRRLDNSEIAKNYALAEHARAAAGTEKATGNQIKIDKFMDSIFKPGESLVQGTARSPGPIARRESARAIIKGIDEAVASKDPERIKAAIASAREQSSRILTGAAPTSQSMHLVTEMQGVFSKAEGIISSLAGSPTEGKQFVRSIHKLVEGIEKENTDQINAAGKIATAKFKTTNAYKNPEMREAGIARIKAVYGEPEPEKAKIPDGWKDTGKFIGGKKAYVDPQGGYHVEQ